METLIKFIKMVKRGISLFVKEIPDNPGFFILSLIGLFSFFELDDDRIHVLSIFLRGETIQAIMISSGFWGMISSLMMETDDQDYWVNCWICCHTIKFIIFLIVAWELLINYEFSKIPVFYIGITIIDLMIIKRCFKETHKNKLLKKNKM